MTAKPCKKCARLIYAGIAHTCPDVNCYYHIPVATPRPPMTAPDDVRARFEAGVSRYMGNGRASLARSEESGIYLVPAVESMWLGYRAAHADLSGEVRELVEAGNRSIVAFEALGKAFGVIATARARQECEAALVAQKAALAKFTQEKP